MGEKMSLQAVRGQIDSCRESHWPCHQVPDSTLAAWSQAITAHLTQPAQAVDVGAIREVIAFMESRALRGAAWERPMLDKLTAALPNANGKEGP